MRRGTVFLIVTMAGLAAPVSFVSAQESGTEADAATVPPAQPQRPPVFSLPPGDVREQPQPDVQGPRAPGISSPRLLGQDAAPSPSSPATSAGPVVPFPQLGTAPPVVVSRPQSTPGASLQPTVPVSRAPTRTQNADPLSASDAPLPQSVDRIPRSEQAPTENEPAAAARADQSGVAWWIWLAGLFVLVGLAAVIRAVRKQRAVEEEEALEPAPLVQRKAEPKAEPEPTSAPKAPTPAVVTAPAAPPAADAPSRIEVDFQPLTARLSTLGLTLSYRLTLYNISDEALSDIAVRLGMRCADGAAMEGAAEAGPPCISLDMLEAGASHAHTAEIVLDPQVFKPLQSKGKAMLVPIVDMFPRYRDSDDVLHEMHAAMLVGRELEPPTPKMQPFWLEQGFGQFGKIGCRMLSVKTA